MSSSKAKKWWHNPCTVFVILYLVLLPVLLTPYIHSNDPVGYSSYLRSVVIDQDLDLANEYTYYKSKFTGVNVERSATGKVTNRYTIGAALFWSPFYIVAHASVNILNSLGFSIPADGYSIPYVFAITFASSLYALFGLLLMYSILRKFFSVFASTTTVFLMWFATPLIFYQFLQASMAHAVSFFSVTLFFYYWLTNRDNRTTSQWFILGLLGGLMTLVRPTNGLFMIIPFLETVVRFKDIFFKKRALHKAAAFLWQNIVFLVALFIAFIPQLITYKIINGAFFSAAAAAKYDPGTLLYPLYLFKVLFSFHGLFSWHPVFIFAVIGLIFLFPKKDKKTAIFCIIAFFLLLYILGTWRGWYGGAAFGQRKFLGGLIFLALGLGSFVDWLEKKIHPLAIIIGTISFIAWNMGLLIQFGSRMIPAGEFVSMTEIITNNFIEVPKKFFEILKTFLFERGKFLKP